MRCSSKGFGLFLPEMSRSGMALVKSLSLWYHLPWIPWDSVYGCKPRLRQFRVRSTGISRVSISTRTSKATQAFSREDDPVNLDISFWWLGQAGFFFRYRDLTFVIDPYLSDCLARKYAASTFKHERLMESPIQAGDMTPLDWIFCTHRHSDHMDPEALPILMHANPKCQIIAPAAEQQQLETLGLSGDRTMLVCAGDQLGLTLEMSVEVLASAHEALKTNEQGQDHYLGFVLRVGGLTIYHSGDCVPYDGLKEKLIQAKVDVAFLPVNGRDELRRQHNIPGNFSFTEAHELCHGAAIPRMVCHHFGMFSFNTVEREVLQGFVEKENALGCVIIPQVDHQYIISKRKVR
jgi:L-ascorbate metabolism protein UlaG (beta-lactamase superfamily)